MLHLNLPCAGKPSPKATSWMDAGLWSKLVQSNADITIPIQGLDFLSRKLQIQGPAADESVFKHMIENSGLWEYHITRFISENLKAGETFIDVGANLGYYTILAAAIVGEQGRVISFEPLKVNSKYCRQNTIINSLDNVSFFNYGLWDEAVEKDITFPTAHHGNAQIIKDDGPEYASIGRETIRCVTLDGMIESGELDLSRLDMVKMDIEGAEPFALKGMQKTLKKFRPAMVFEMNRLAMMPFHLTTEVIWDFFQELNYELFVFPEYVKGLKFKKIEKADQLNQVCPPDSLVDLVGRPKESSDEIKLYNLLI